MRQLGKASGFRLRGLLLSGGFPTPAAEGEGGLKSRERSVAFSPPFPSFNLQLGLEGGEGGEVWRGGGGGNRWPTMVATDLSILPHQGRPREEARKGNFVWADGGGSVHGYQIGGKLAPGG